MKKKPSKKQLLKKELDKLIQQKYVPLHKHCLICTRPVSCMHHYIQKSQSLWLRWDERNLIPICAYHHCLHHQSGDPRVHQEILKKKGHKWADELEKERRIIFKDTIANLQAIKEGL